PAWSPIATSPAPPPRALFGGISDPDGGRMLIADGYQGTATPLGDVWGLSLGVTPAWSQVMPDGTPPAARWSHGVTYDPGLKQVLVYGGSTTGSNLMGDVWALRLQQTPSIFSLDPPGGGVGDEVHIIGGHLHDVTAVDFNGTAATISSQTRTLIVTHVPLGA